MDDSDLDAFICNIEQTAPEDTSDVKFCCRECGNRLEEDEDGNFTCPVCSVQATNILQLDDTELHHDEQGRPVYGQRVQLAEKNSKHQTEYGWAWSTDEAISYILDLQLNALRKANIVPETFYQGAKNMWLTYWVQTVSPHIKDDYSADELVPISTSKAMKLRDIEVLVKSKDKVMVPLHLIRRRRDAKVIYKMLGAKFRAVHLDDFVKNLKNEDNDYADTDDESSSSASSGSSLEVGPYSKIPDSLMKELNDILANEQAQDNKYDESDFVEAVSERRGTVDKQVKQQIVEDEHLEEIKTLDKQSVEVDSFKDLAPFCRKQTQNLSQESIKILTLNRTLAFIEATARCLPEDDPLFAADIIRGCNQFLIPFYNSSKTLPESMKLNSRDRLMFQKIGPPTPLQLTRTASLLINGIYREDLPKTLPVPNLNKILERFITDMNLPRELFEVIRDKVSFLDFAQTKPKTFVKNVNRVLPQYDRWAFAVLVCHLKRLFNLEENFLDAQKDYVDKLVSTKPGNYFRIDQWIKQMDARLDLILQYDPCVLYHPLADPERLELTPQMASYVKQLLDARPTSDTRAKRVYKWCDEQYRCDLAEFLKCELCPTSMSKTEPAHELRISKSVKYPLTDSLERAFSILSQEHIENKYSDVIFKDFRDCNLALMDNLLEWSVYDVGVHLTKRNLQISPTWPQAYKMMIHVGAFICLCEPVDLVNEVRLVEEFFQPDTKVRKRLSLFESRAKVQSKCVEYAAD